VFGRQLRIEDVNRRGISSMGDDAVAKAAADGLTIREVATLDPRNPGLRAPIGRVEPVALEDSDPLARVDGTDNAIACEAEPLGEILVRGPGAGVDLASQGVLSDLINVMRRSDLLGAA
jgi:homoserine dehydrogenase